LIIFLEIKDFKRPGIHRQDNAELLQGVGPAGLVGLRFQQRFSANYFQTAFLLLADPAMGGGFNSLATFSRGPRGRHAHFSANFRKTFFGPPRRQHAQVSRGWGCVQKTPRNWGWGVVMEWLNEGLR
jgi:hypothetical protein